MVSFSKVYTKETYTGLQLNDEHGRIPCEFSVSDIHKYCRKGEIYLVNHFPNVSHRTLSELMKEHNLLWTTEARSNSMGGGR